MPKTAKLPVDYQERTRIALRNIVRVAYLLNVRGVEGLYPEEHSALAAALTAFGHPFTKTNRRSRLRTADRAIWLADQAFKDGDPEEQARFNGFALRVLGFAPGDIVAGGDLDEEEWLLVRDYASKHLPKFKPPDEDDVPLWNVALARSKIAMRMPTTALDKIRLDTWFSVPLGENRVRSYEALGRLLGCTGKHVSAELKGQQRRASVRLVQGDRDWDGVDWDGSVRYDDLVEFVDGALREDRADAHVLQRRRGIGRRREAKKPH